MAISIIEYLYTEVIVYRNIFPFWYLATGIVLVTVIILSIVMDLKKFGVLVLIIGAIISAIWEITLFVSGLRAYNNPLAQLIGPIPEIIYHSFSEGPATTLLGLLIIYKLRIIDLEKFKDENWTIRNEKKSKREYPTSKEL